MAQNFSGQNLRGQSFKDRNLQGANFSHADIRNINFTNANLRNTDFSHAKAGIQPYLAVLLLNSSFLCSALLGVALELGLRAVLPRPDSKPIIGMAVFLLLVTFYTITIQRGLAGAALATVSIAIIVTVVGVGVGIGPGFEAEASVGAMTGVLSVALVGLGVVAVSIVGAVAMIITEIKAITGVVVSALFGACVVAITGIIDQLTIVVIAITGTATILGAYVAIRALAGDQKFAFVNPIAIGFAANGGTSFCGANLTDANFSQATLKSTDFRGATVTRTCWFQARKLSFACVGKTTYLKNSQVRQLVITGQGQEKNFDHQNLRGVNLKGANLVDASFIGADLSQANLQDADLSRAKLVQTQLDGTDFTGATLTAAYIQDWGITTDTKFDGVRCEYVYMRLPTKENPDPLRKPDNNKEVFADGEFGDFIQPIFDTLDLYHNQGVDPRAIAISFKQLAENHPEADLRIVGMEVRGEDKFLLRAKTLATADKSELSSEYFATYNEIKGLPEREIKLLLAEKDNQILRLENMVMTALERPSFYSNVEQVGFMTNNPGGFSVGGSVGGNVNNVQGDNNRAVQGDNNQAVLGDNNQVTQKNQVGGDASLTKDDVVKLLAELEALVKTAELPADTKDEVIEDLNAAKKATDKEEPNKNRALERLTSVADTLEKTTKTVESSQKIWTTAKPIIVKVAAWLGAAAGSHLLGL